MKEEIIKSILLENEKLKNENKKLREQIEEKNKTTPSIYTEIESNRDKKIENKTSNNTDKLKFNNSEIPISEKENIWDPFEEDMRIISYLVRSNKRVLILKSLNKSNKIPSQIGKEIGDSSHHVSKYLASLKEKGLVICLNEEDKRFRFYSITAMGKYYLELIEKKDYLNKE